VKEFVKVLRLCKISSSVAFTTEITSELPQFAGDRKPLGFEGIQMLLKKLENGRYCFNRNRNKTESFFE
jgi:hypothetical protein